MNVKRAREIIEKAFNAEGVLAVVEAGDRPKKRKNCEVLVWIFITTPPSERRTIAVVREWVRARQGIFRASDVILGAMVTLYEARWALHYLHSRNEVERIERGLYQRRDAT